MTFDVLKAEGATTEDILTLDILELLTARRINFRAGHGYVFLFWYDRDTMSSIMSDQERIRYIQEQANKFVSRNKCVDASLQTLKVQATAGSQRSGNTLLSPATVPAVMNNAGCANNVTITGVGTGGEYFGILQIAQGNAIQPRIPNEDTGVAPVITLPVPCINMQAPPFTQQNLSSFYVTPCTDPGKIDYFPPPIYDGPGCTYTRITTPSG